MTDNQNTQEYEESETPAENFSDPITETAQGLSDEAAKQEYKKLFTLRFHIPLEDYIQFHLVMGKEAIAKSRRKAAFIGWAEFGLGILFLLSLFFTEQQGSIYYYVMIAILIFVGLYGVVFYRFFYEKSVGKAIARQYKKTAYLQNEIVVDFYPNKYVEHVDGKELDTYWHSIKDLRVSETLFIIMAEERRCLLIPKASIPKQREALDALLNQVCDNFEKKRYDL